MDLSSEVITVPPTPLYPLFLCAKRYWVGNQDEQDDPDAVTLIFLHATSFHKETWEPTLQVLFGLDRASEGSGKRRRRRVREAFALDCPNHGPSAILNESLLLDRKLGFYLSFTCEKYAKAVWAFLESTNNTLHWSKRKLVGVGHSLGGNAMCLLQSLPPAGPRWSFTSLIIIEPMLSAHGPEHLAKLRTLLIAGAYERRDVWPNRQIAAQALKRRDRTKKWDSRVLDVFIAHAIRPHPGAYYDTSPYAGVTLCCTRENEAAMYRDPEGATKPVYSLNEVCQKIPVHVVLGGIYDFMPKRTHQALIDPASGRKFASITTLDGVGHLVTQEAPDKLAAALYDALKMNAEQGKLKSKL